MAFVNPNKPAGLSPVKYLNAANYDGKGNVYCILASDTNPYYRGDIVKLVAAGGATASDANGIPAVTLASTGNTVIGVIVAVGANQASLLGPDGGPYVNVANMGNTTYRPSGAQPMNYYALVSDDPNIVYEVQEGGTGTNYTHTAVGRYAPFLYAAPSNPVSLNPMSGTTLNDTAAAAAAVNDLFILSFARRIDNNFVTNPSTGGGAQKWWVLLGHHQFVTRAASV